MEALAFAWLENYAAPVQLYLTFLEDGLPHN
jgi:hypothetical protein